MDASLPEREKLARIKANAFTYLRSDWYDRLEAAFGGAAAILEHSPRELSHEGGVSQETAANFLAEAAALDAEAELEKAARAGVSLITRGEPGYPEGLADLYDAPLAVYVKGCALSAAPKLGMVGTRQVSPYGARTATALGRELAGRGLVIVSGLARGVDTLCHEAALYCKAPTWAVVGTGLGKCYPPENMGLADRIVSGGGAIISEFPFDKGPMGFHFPRRNRIIAALSFATLVIEGDIKSGALITAKQALDLGRDVMAVPGPIDSPRSAGPNRLIKDGALTILSAEDVLLAVPSSLAFGLKPAAGAEKGKSVPLPVFEGDAAAALTALGSEEATLDMLTGRLGWTVPRAAAALFELEAAGAVACSNGVYAKRI